MQICKIEVSMDDLKKIHSQGIKYELKVVDVDDFDYSNDDTWVRLRHESLKAYKKLKAREYDLRHNIKKNG